jgi:hypothetical protein
MKFDFLVKKNRRLNFTSKYNVKLYKKCLSLKLISIDFKENKDLPNLIISKNNQRPVKNITNIYCRNELICIRLFLFFDSFDFSKTKKKGVKFSVSKKIFVYNGKVAKLINIKQGLFEVIIQCGFKFGSLIFTRDLYKFKSRKKKNKIDKRPKKNVINPIKKKKKIYNRNRKNKDSTVMKPRRAIEFIYNLTWHCTKQ